MLYSGFVYMHTTWINVIPFLAGIVPHYHNRYDANVIRCRAFTSSGNSLPVAVHALLYRNRVCDWALFIKFINLLIVSMETFWCCSLPTTIQYVLHCKFVITANVYSIHMYTLLFCIQKRFNKYYMGIIFNCSIPSLQYTE